MQYEKPPCNAPIVDHVSNKLCGVMKYNLPNKYTTYSSGAVQVRSESSQRSYYDVCCHYAKQHKCCVQEAVYAVRDAT